MFILVFVRLSNPIMIFPHPNTRDINPINIIEMEIDPLFSSGNAYEKLKNKGFGRNSYWNLVHIFVIILFGFSFVYIIEKGGIKYVAPEEVRQEEEINHS